jgi:hypothetical protein
MIKGLAITPPVIRRIAIGKVVEKNGKRLPEKDDAFTITTQVQQRGEWILHPLHNSLIAQQDGGKLRSIPVTLLFNDSDLNLRTACSTGLRAGRCVWVMVRWPGAAHRTGSRAFPAPALRIVLWALNWAASRMDG